jgi:hypothetical protein
VTLSAGEDLVVEKKDAAALAGEDGVGGFKIINPEIDLISTKPKVTGSNPVGRAPVDPVKAAWNGGVRPIASRPVVNANWAI